MKRGNLYNKDTDRLSYILTLITVPVLPDVDPIWPCTGMEFQIFIVIIKSIYLIDPDLQKHGSAEMSEVSHESPTSFTLVYRTMDSRMT